jgi:hypothetical protein
VNVGRDEIIPLLDAIGGKGVYIMTSFATCKEAETLMTKVAQYRGFQAGETRLLAQVKNHN